MYPYVYLFLFIYDCLIFHYPFSHSCWNKQNLNGTVFKSSLTANKHIKNDSVHIIMTQYSVKVYSKNIVNTILWIIICNAVLHDDRTVIQFSLNTYCEKSDIILNSVRSFLYSCELSQERVQLRFQYFRNIFYTGFPLI